MKKPIMILACLVLCSIAEVLGQTNLVMDPSMEQFTSEYNPLCDSFLTAVYWKNPTGANPNYMNSATDCPSEDVPDNGFGHQYAYDGNAYYFCGLFEQQGPFQEYVQGQLTDTLTPGKEYCVSIYLSLAEYSQFAIDCIGAYFSDTAITIAGQGVLPVVPQVASPSGIFYSDKIHWMKLSGSFIAGGGERYITIGNFKDYLTTNTLYIDGGGGPNWTLAGYYIDMIIVIPCDSIPALANAGEAVSICPGDSALIGTSARQYYDYSWSPARGLSDSTIAQPLASPVQTTTYTLTVKYFDLSITTDIVTVQVEYCGPTVLFIPNVFSPNGDGQNEVLYARGENVKEIQFSVYNRWGELVFETKDINAGWDGSYKGKECSPSVYVYQVMVTYKDGSVQSKWGTATLIR